MSRLTYRQALEAIGGVQDRAFAMLLSGQRRDGTPIGSILGSGDTVGYESETLTVSTNVVVLSQEKYAPADQTPAAVATITVENAPVRVLTTGQMPTGSTGHLIEAGGAFKILGEGNIANARLVRSASASSDATIQVSYERQQ